MKELSIVRPILNEAKNITQLIPEINKIKKKIKLNRLEVLLIDGVLRALREFYYLQIMMMHI